MPPRTCLVILACVVGLQACSNRTQAQPPYSFEQLRCLSWAELEQIYLHSEIGNLPTGFNRGKPIYCQDDHLAGVKNHVAGFVWRGKIFPDCDSIMINQWLCFKGVKARVYVGPSWLDGKPSLILDYLGMSHLIWAKSRDEIREVAPGLWLGMMYQRGCPEPTRKTFFVLEGCCRPH
jgi:hypothetical protein